MTTLRCSTGRLFTAATQALRVTIAFSYRLYCVYFFTTMKEIYFVCFFLRKRNGI